MVDESAGIMISVTLACMTGADARAGMPRTTAGDREAPPSRAVAPHSYEAAPTMSVPTAKSVVAIGSEVLRRCLQLEPRDGRLALSPCFGSVRKLTTQLKTAPICGPLYKVKLACLRSIQCSARRVV